MWLVARVYLSHSLPNRSSSPCCVCRPSPLTAHGTCDACQVARLSAEIEASNRLLDMAQRAYVATIACACGHAGSCVGFCTALTEARPLDAQCLRLLP